MNDKKDNVVPFRSREGRTAAQDPAAQQRHREREDAVVARASEIREWVSTFRGRLPLAHRIQLATNLGRMLYPADRMDRGDLTDILVAARISRREDHTKRLPRYAMRPGRDTPSPKLLAAKPAGYLAIVEALARHSGYDKDKAVFELFDEVIPSDRATEGETSKDDVADFIPLYRLVLAIGDGAIKAAPCTIYFDDLARDRWIPAIDALSRDMGVTAFGLPPFELYPEEPPEVSGIWLLDRNEFAMDPNELEFFEDRMGLLPKVPIYREDYARFYLDVPNDYRTFWSGDGSNPQVDLQEINVELGLFLWLVVAPSGPTRVPTPYLARFISMRVSGGCALNGEPLAFETHSAPGHITFIDFSKGEVELGFTPSESLHVNFSFRLQEARLESRFVENSIDGGLSPPFQDWPSSENVMGMNLLKHIFRLDAAYDSAYVRPRLIPITPSSVAKELSVPRSLRDDDVEEISVLSVAPFRTSGSVVETMLRSPHGKELQDELIGSVRSLLIKQEKENERLRIARTAQLDDALNELSAPSNLDQEES
jgi:hypothetical protein